MYADLPANFRSRERHVSPFLVIVILVLAVVQSFCYVTIKAGLPYAPPLEYEDDAPARGLTLRRCLRGVAQLGSAPALGASCRDPIFHDSPVTTRDSSTIPEYDFLPVHGVRVR